VSELINDRNKFKKLFANTTSRFLLGLWLLAKGSRLSMQSVAEIISMPEDALEAKLQTFAGMGLVHVNTNEKGERQVEFLPSPTPDFEKILWDLFDGRKHDFESVELKARAVVYKTLLNSIL
jgi:hypothetical protein